MSWQIKNLIYIILSLSIFSLSLYLFITKRGVSEGIIEKTAVEKRSQLLNNDFSYVESEINHIDKELRSIINGKKITVRNCKGLLRADNYTELFISTDLFKDLPADREFKLNVFYDLCSYNFKDNNPINLIFFTNDMLKNVEKNNIAAISVDTNINGIVKSKKGLIPLSLLADYF